MTERVACPHCSGAGFLAPGGCAFCEGEGNVPPAKPWPEMTEKMARVRCVHCEAVGFVEAYWKLEIKPPGTFSLAGNTMKASAYWWPYARCGACGHESRGKMGAQR